MGGIKLKGRIEFLYHAIDDTQSTIRAIDIKIGFLFVVIVLPMTKLSSIYSNCMLLIDCSCWYWLIVGAFAVSWFLAVVTLFTSLVSISDPRKHIPDVSANGCFYDGGLFNFCLFDFFINFPVKSSKTMQDFIFALPCDDDAIVKELAFEKMKLVYIREIKIKRSSFCIKMMFLWIFLGGIVWSINLIK